jgi:hypothetical protein
MAMNAAQHVKSMGNGRLLGFLLREHLGIFLYISLRYETLIEF